jgi:hypothetical protein
MSSSIALHRSRMSPQAQPDESEAIRDVSDLRTAKMIAELLAAEDRFNAWEMANGRAGQAPARRVAGDQARDLHRANRLADQDLQRSRAADGIRAAIAHALTLRLEPGEIIEIARRAVGRTAAVSA